MRNLWQRYLGFSFQRFYKLVIQRSHKRKHHFSLSKSCFRILYISFKDDNTILNRFGIFDVQGNKVEIPVEKINDKLFKINTSTLADGIYFIINYHSKNESIKKFIKLKQ
ncbi:MAG: T9SS type A sorting domain-containing protein [Saprospiraceae bacterium]|nr:T9SS type A sorting domain-containing protein [Saprospiraceae bacterium]